jgi:hypothetical protein
MPLLSLRAFVACKIGETNQPTYLPIHLLSKISFIGWHIILIDTWETSVFGSVLLRNVEKYTWQDEVLNSKHSTYLWLVRTLQSKTESTDTYWYAVKLLGFAICTVRLFAELSTRWRIWLRHCATSRKVAGSVPFGVTFLGSTKSLTDISTRDNTWG